MSSLSGLGACVYVVSSLRVAHGYLAGDFVLDLIITPSVVFLHVCLLEGVTNLWNP